MKIENRNRQGARPGLGPHTLLGMPPASDRQVIPINLVDRSAQKVTSEDVRVLRSIAIEGDEPAKLPVPSSAPRSSLACAWGRLRSTAIAGAAALAGGAFAALVPVPLSTTARGVLHGQGEGMAVIASRAGVVREVRVANAQRVAAGQVLLTLDTTRLQAELPDIEQTEVQAPSPGIILGFDTRVGQPIEAGQLVGRVIPAEPPRRAVVYIEDAEPVSIGAPVELEAEGPESRSVRFAGRVVTVARTGAVGEGAAAPSYRIEIELLEREKLSQVLPGTPVIASLSAAPRTLVELALDRLRDDH